MHPRAPARAAWLIPKMAYCAEEISVKQTRLEKKAEAERE